MVDPAPPTNLNPTGLKMWWLAVRPRTLSIAVVPVVVGNALAWAEMGRIDWLVAGITLITALCIQAGVNLHNDAADFERGGDKPDRKGPRRVTAQGWATPGQVYQAAAVAFGGALAGGCYLVWVGGWPIAILGLAALVSGWAYSGGPRPISYSPLGELFVFVFFGVSAVAGSHYLQAGHLAAAAVIAGAALGLPAAAVLVVNNTRDRESDRRAGRRTLAVRMGPASSKVLYATLMALPFALVALLAPHVQGGAGLWLTAPAALPALILVRRFWTEDTGLGFNRLLAGTAQVQVLFGLLLGVGLIL